MQRLRRGLTFLEVTVVVIIIGLLAAIGTPHFARSARARNTRNAAIQLADYVGYARNVAINEGRSTSLSIDASADRFTSPDVDFPGRAGTLISLSVKETFDSSLELSASFDTATTLTFDLEGVPSVAGTPLTAGVISISSPGIAYQILIDGGHGTVSITEVSVTPEISESQVSGEDLLVDGG